jgi:NADPH-dependent F420 reductase
VDIAIVGGTGAEGVGLARRLARAGHRVVIGSRSEERAIAAAGAVAGDVRDLVGGTASVEGATNQDAVERVDLAFVTVPFEGLVKVYESIKEHVRPGSVIVDTTSPLESALGGPAWHIVHPWAGSAAEEAAGVLGDGVRLVAGFHSLAAGMLRDLDHDLEADVLLSGDDAEAKEIVGSLVEQIPNLRWADAGDLSTARITESLTALMISVNRTYRMTGAALRLVGRETWGAPGT